MPLSGVQCRQRNMAQTNADGADDRRTSETTIPRRTVDSGSTGGAAPSSLLTPGGGGGGGGGGAAADNARTLQHSPMGMPDVKTSMPHPRKRSVSSDLSPIKRIRSASDAFRFSNPFKKFGRLGLLPFVHKRYINDGTSEVKPWIDQATNTPKLFNKASQRQLSEFREYHQKKRSNMAIPSFLRANAVRFLLKVGDLSLVVQEVLGSGGYVRTLLVFGSEGARLARSYSTQPMIFACLIDFVSLSCVGLAWCFEPRLWRLQWTWLLNSCFFRHLPVVPSFSKPESFLLRFSPLTPSCSTSLCASGLNTTTQARSSS